MDELTQEEIKMLIQIISAAPMQGNMKTLAPMLEKMVTIQEKLAAGLQKLDELPSVDND